MAFFVFGLIAPRPDFAMTMTDDEHEDELRAFAAQDPVVATGTARIELGKMLAGFVRPNPA